MIKQNLQRLLLAMVITASASGTLANNLMLESKVWKPEIRAAIESANLRNYLHVSDVAELPKGHVLYHDNGLAYLAGQAEPTFVFASLSTDGVEQLVVSEMRAPLVMGRQFKRDMSRDEFDGHGNLNYLELYGNSNT